MTTAHVDPLTLYAPLYTVLKWFDDKNGESIHEDDPWPLPLEEYMKVTKSFKGLFTTQVDGNGGISARVTEKGREVIETYEKHFKK